MFNKIVDWVASNVWGFDNGTKYLCQDKLYQRHEEKCYRGGGDVFCVTTDKIITTKVRECVKVDRFAVDYRMFLAQFQGLK